MQPTVEKIKAAELRPGSRHYPQERLGHPMMTVLLPDGTAATTPIYAGPRPATKQCADEQHEWLPNIFGRKELLQPGPVEIGGITFTHISLELCNKCRWCRSRLYPKEKV